VGAVAAETLSPRSNPAVEQRTQSGTRLSDEEISPYVPTGIALGKRVWLWSDGGMLTCLDAPTGKILYRERVGEISSARRLD